MKIALASGLHPSEIGGPASYARLLELELPQNGIEVKTVPYGWVRQYPLLVRHAVYTWKLWRESSACNVLYALDPIGVGLPALVVAKLRRRPLVVRVAGDYAWELGRTKLGLKGTLDEYLQYQETAPLRVRLLAKLQTYVVSRADTVIVPSLYLKNIAIGKWGIRPEKVSVIHSALYPLEVSADKETLRSQLAYTEPTLVSAAQLVPWKGFRVLLEVVAKLQAKYPGLSLVIIGDGQERERLEAQVAKLQLQAQVRFTGRISKDALGAAIKAADVFVLNTAYEGLSHQLIEVMDLGVPIVTTKSGGNPELITDGVNGYLVDFNDVNQLHDAVVRVLSNPDSRERITQSARGRSKDFQKQIVMQEIVRVLQEYGG